MTKRPVLAIWLVERFGGRYRRHELAGDLLEQLHNGRSRAWLWGQALYAIAARVASRTRSGRMPPATSPSVTRHGFGRYWHEYRGALAFLLLIAVFRSAWADWVYVPTGSMNPTILE